jgi:NAD(P)-dependent dehydrogenase (short-subunit alcohol dehydrogenase family)
MAVAFITGASTGIGLETAILFARRGCRVYAGARRPEGSTGLQRAIDEGLPITPVVLDVDSDESVRAAVARVGAVDVLVNNAGIGSAGPVELMPMAEIRALFETNVFGAVRMMQAVLPAMRERRSGVIVNVTSIMGHITLPCHGYYAATKFALFAVSESLAMEMTPLGIRVAIIEPGVVLTPIWGKRAPTMPAMPEYRQGQDRLMRTFESQMEGGVTPDVVAEAIYRAAIGGDDRIRIQVGEDAEVWAAARDRSTTEQWVSLYAEADDTRFRSRAEQTFGVDTLASPSLHARRSTAIP